MISLEKGKYNPSLSLAFRLARYFGLPIEQIFFCEPISDIFPPLVSILVYALTIKRVINRGPQKQTA